jgi:uncharacterized protein (TIGR03067 family)
MSKLVSVLLLLAGTTGNVRHADEFSKEEKKELDQLQGEWLVKEMARAGKTQEAAGVKLVLEIKDAKWIFTGQHKGDFVAFHTNTDPKGYDIKRAEKGLEGQIQEGIYKIEGDTLILCFYQGKDKFRPTRFEAPESQPDTILVTLKRAKKE